MSDCYLPALPGLTRTVRRGRCVFDGYQRGWGLEFGGLHALVRADPIYQRAMELAAPYIIQDEMRRMNVYLILRFYLQHLPPGDIVEFGSYRGGSAILMASIMAELYPERLVYALDTYAGMPETDKAVDAHSAGDFGDADLEALVRYADAKGLANLRFVKGLFQDTWPKIIAENAPSVALAHIDCDIKSAVEYAYYAVKPAMVMGGYLVLDDATVSSCIGATEAVEEIIQNDHAFSEQIWPHYVFRHGLASDG